MAIAYAHGRGLYLNLTNRCPVSCSFCVKRTWRWRFEGWDLRLGSRNPPIDEAWQELQALARRRPFREIVFCGFGESTLRLTEMLELARRARKRWPGTALRLDTIGLGNLHWGRDIAPRLREELDSVRISLNTADAGQWLDLHRPSRAYHDRGFASVLGFVLACVRAGLGTTVTAVEQPGVDLAAVRRLARSLGARFLARSWLGPLNGFAVRARPGAGPAAPAPTWARRRPT